MKLSATGYARLLALVTFITTANVAVAAEGQGCDLEDRTMRAGSHEAEPNTSGVVTKEGRAATREISCTMVVAISRTLIRPPRGR